MEVTVLKVLFYAILLLGEQAQMESGGETKDFDMENEENEDDVFEVPPIPNPIGSGSETVDTSSAVSRRHLKSVVWAYFNILPLGPDKKQRCKCKKCGVTYACPSNFGTGNLHKHIKACTRRDTRDIGQLLVTRESSTLNLTTPKFSQEKYRELFVAAIIMHEEPFQFVEYEGFRALHHYLNNKVQTISRNTCKADVLKNYAREKERMKYMLQSTPGRICFTSDLWTSIVTDGYMSLTAHFIDKDWHLQKRILNFSIIPPPHTGVNLCEKMYSLFLDWGIEKKVFTMTLDNASSNACFINLLISQLNVRKLLVCNGEYVHVRCCAHILNLVVQDGLKVIPECIDKIRDSIKYLKASDARKVKFRECVKNMGIAVRKGLRQDVSTRWNSTFLMLDSAIYYRQAFGHLALVDSSYISCPNDNDWKIAEKICKFLSVFYEITQIFSGSTYPTSNLYFPVVAIAHLTLKDKLDDDDEFIRSMADKMYVKFQKYWADFSTILAIACILDPRYKLSSIDFFYKKIYGANSFRFDDLKEKLFSLFNEYASNASTSEQQPLTQKQGRADILYANEGRDVFKELDEYENDESVQCAKKTQLELYLEEPKIDRKSNSSILDFWKGNEFRYPELAAMARDILSIPISTVASESTFSAGGRVLDQYRNSLLPDTAQAIICSRDWLYGEKAAAKLKMEELTEDIMNLDINKNEADTA